MGLEGEQFTLCLLSVILREYGLNQTLIYHGKITEKKKNRGRRQLKGV